MAVLELVKENEVELRFNALHLAAVVGTPGTSLTTVLRRGIERLLIRTI